MLSEFDIIRTCFDQPGLTAEKNDVVRQGIGDDCALLSIPQGQDLAFSMDTLVENIHFPASAPAELIASRSLAVNLSDLAATGAAPAPAGAIDPMAPSFVVPPTPGGSYASPCRARAPMLTQR